jgi:membrane protease YdiL (CAAX protease family)
MSSPDTVPAVVASLIAVGLGASVLTWLAISTVWLQGRPVLPPVEVTVPRIPPGATLAALGWLAFVLVNRLAVVGAKPIEPQLSHVWLNLLLSAGVFGLLSLLLFAERRYTPREAGFVPTPLTGPTGSITFVASILPTFAMLLALMPVRSRETQHQLLQLLGRSPDVPTLAGMAVTVIVVAPLAEELLFRVTLQGWLTSHIGRRAAVPIVAIAFAGVHGWRDGIALVPLALLLGMVYDRRRDFFAVVIAHGAFNGANLFLALLAIPSPE